MTLMMRVIKTNEGTLLALCEKELLGKVFGEGGARLDLDKYSKFYVGEDVNEESRELAAAIRDAASINAVGERALAALERAGVDTKERRAVGGVSHIQIYRL